MPCGTAPLKVWICKAVREPDLPVRGVTFSRALGGEEWSINSACYYSCRGLAMSAVPRILL